MRIDHWVVQLVAAAILWNTRRRISQNVAIGIARSMDAVVMKAGGKKDDSAESATLIAKEVDDLSGGHTRSGGTVTALPRIGAMATGVSVSGATLKIGDTEQGRNEAMKVQGICKSLDASARGFMRP
jgi:hypothetical protein